MKLIAHRGASLERPENTLESLTHGARLGADAVECDVRATLDEQYVIFHDPSLERLCNIPAWVNGLTLSQMAEALAKAGRGLLTLADLFAGYRESTPVLLHIKLDKPEPALLERLASAPLPLILGVQTVEVLEAVRAFQPPERILAFVPSPEAIPAFARAGAGILRLWENWLDAVTPDQARATGAREVWIMSGDAQGSMDGSAESLNRFARLGADGALLNDIVLGLAWRGARS
ncbi:MAG TPA: glycerophosphodiester phosphodiesterase family protein [Clostridia bacterium]|nr:glycerophosphodiester phosphodiesterase family protein [Clostridia bacterium]